MATEIITTGMGRIVRVITNNIQSDVVSITIHEMAALGGRDWMLSEWNVPGFSIDQQTLTWYYTAVRPLKITISNPGVECSIITEDGNTRTFRSE